MRAHSWGLQIGQRGRTVRRLMGHLRPGLCEGQGAAVRHRGQPAPRRTERRIARAATTARRLRRHGSGTADSRRAPLAPRGSSPCTLHWAATAGLVGDGIHEAESAMTAAEAWWSRRAELSS